MINQRVSIIVLALVAGLSLQQQQFVQANSAFNVGFLGGLDSSSGRQGGFLTSTFGNTMDLAQGIPNLLNNAVSQVTKPLDGIVGSVLNPVGSTLSSLTGGLTGQIGAGLSLASSDNPLGRRAVASGSKALNSISLPTGVLGGLTTGLAAATGLNSVTNAAEVATQGLTNPGRLAGALTGAGGSLGGASAVGSLSDAARTAGALSGAARTAGALSGAAHTAGALSAASQAAGATGALGALGSSAAAAATALNSNSNMLNRAASASSLGRNLENLHGQAIMNSMNGGGSINYNSLGEGMQNVRNSFAASTAAAGAALGAQNAISNSMSPYNSYNQLSGQNSLTNMNQINGMTPYSHLQRREAIPSGTGLIGSSSLDNSIGQSELMSGSDGAAATAAAATAGLEAASLAGGAKTATALASAADLSSGRSLGAIGLGTGLNSGFGSGIESGIGSGIGSAYGLGYESGIGSGYGPGINSAIGSGMGMRAAEAAGVIGGLASGASLGPDSHLLAPGALGASSLPYLGGVGLQQAGHEAAALGQAAAAAGGPLAINNHMAAGVIPAQQLIHGVAHQPGMAVGQAIARDAIDSTARSLGASRALEAAALPLAAAGNGPLLAPISGALSAEPALTEPIIENPLTPARQSLAASAHANAEAESAIAGSDMVAHGLENSQSASLATNAYRQAKLASARDRINIAGTIQNSARISDAAIATHDAATKAEDSLLGSELAVDSAATVLDSDAAYIPPVTNSMLRSLPYGRLGLRNIVPKPLNYPSVLLPDVWLNGMPVSYKNLPFRMMPYGIGPDGSAPAIPAMASIYGVNRQGGAEATGVAATNGIEAAVQSGIFLEGQPILSNNGIYMNGLLVDPKYAYLKNKNVEGSSIMPILANGQLEAQDEINMANILTAQQQLGPGMLGTYNGYGRLNTVPMLTGSVSDANLAPTTTVGTTYPIGSALVIEPRDSYFQDYIDNASSRQNFDERHQ